MANRAMFYGPDSIMTAFDAMRGGTYCCWSMWSGNVKLAQYSGNDSQEAETMLNDTVSVGERTGNRELIQVRIHPRIEDIYTTKSPVVATLLCCCSSNEPNAAIQGTQDYNTLPSPLYHTFKDMLADAKVINEALLTRLEALSAPVEPVEPHWVDRVSGIIKEPEIAGLLSQLITALPGVLGSFIKTSVPVQVPDYAIGKIPENSMTNNIPANIADNSDARSNIAQSNDVGQLTNVHDHIADNSDAAADQHFLTDAENDIIDNALARLSAHMNIVCDLPLLADYATKNPEMFKMLLMQLKAQ